MHSLCHVTPRLNQHLQHISMARNVTEIALLTRLCIWQGLDYTLPAQQTVKQSKLEAHAQKLTSGALASPPSPQHPLRPLLADLHYNRDQLQLTAPQAPRVRLACL